MSKTPGFIENTDEQSDPPLNPSSNQAKGCNNFKPHPALPEHCLNCKWGIKLHPYQAKDDTQSDKTVELRRKVAELFNRANNHNPGSRSQNINELMELITAHSDRLIQEAVDKAVMNVAEAACSYMDSQADRAQFMADVLNNTKGPQ